MTLSAIDREDYDTNIVCFGRSPVATNNDTQNVVISSGGRVRYIFLRTDDTTCVSGYCCNQILDEILVLHAK